MLTPIHPFRIEADIDWARSRPSDEGDVLICAINLDRSQDRWEALGAQLEASGLPYLRLRAFEGRNLDPQLQAQVDHDRFEKAMGRRATAGDTGCYFSHAAAWTVLADKPQRYLLIVEDDAIFEENWTVSLKSALKHHTPGTLLKLSWQRKGVVREVGEIDDAHTLVRPLSHQACNAAYLIDRKAAEHLLQNAFPFFLPADHYTESPWLTAVPVRTIFPALARQRGVVSTISKPVKFHWSDRLPTLLYRIKSHFLRLWYGWTRTA